MDARIFYMVPLAVLMIALNTFLIFLFVKLMILVFKALKKYVDDKPQRRESEILRRLCEHRNEIVSTQSILLELWGDDSFFNSRSLHVFITKLRQKLSKDERIRIVNVRGIGYKLVVQE